MNKKIEEGNDQKQGKQKQEKGGELSMKDIKIWPPTPVAIGIKSVGLRQ